MGNTSPTLSVTVVMATFNGERFLGEQLASLSGQSRQPDGLVISDDASSDGTLDIATAFARKAPFPVRIIQNPTRVGYADNFMRAALGVTSDVISFCDQDDVWHRDKLRLSVGALEQSERLVLVSHAALVMDQSGRVSGQAYPRVSRTSCFSATDLPLHNFPGFTFTFRRSLLSAAGKVVRTKDLGLAPLAHDQWVWLLAPCVGEVLLLEEALAWYRKHTQNAFGAPKVTLGVIRKLSRDDFAAMYTAQADEMDLFARSLMTLACRWEMTSPAWSHAAISRASIFQSRARWGYERSALYSSRSRADRFRYWLHILRGGGYCSNSLNRRLPRSAIKDLMVAVYGGAFRKRRISNSPKGRKTPLDAPDGSPHGNRRP